MVRITDYDHVGIRVSDRTRALDFYGRLGFTVDAQWSDDEVAEVVNGDGARINLIFNGVARPGAHNILLDEPCKWPGVTHPAFVVDSLQEVLDWAAANAVAITEGPLDWGRRRTCFLRDPDGNVLEFNEMTDDRPNGPGKSDATLVLHEYPASGNCYKIRLTAAHLGVPIERRGYDIVKGETRTPDFLARVNANGRIPVLQIGDRFLPESNAACVFLARGSRLIPGDRFDEADMLRWMFWEQYTHEPNVATMRFWTGWIGLDTLAPAQAAQVEGKRAAGDAALRLMDEHLASRDWLAGGDFSLADICLYAYTHVAGDGGFDLGHYPALQRWLARVAAQPGHVPMDA